MVGRLRCVEGRKLIEMDCRTIGSWLKWYCVAAICIYRTRALCRQCQSRSVIFMRPSDRSWIKYIIYVLRICRMMYIMSIIIIFFIYFI